MFEFFGVHLKHTMFEHVRVMVHKLVNIYTKV